MTNIQKRFSAITILLLFIAKVAYGQDTTYYTNDGLKLLSKDKAECYQVVKESAEKANTKEINVFYISGRKKISGISTIVNINFVVLKKAKPIWGYDGKYQEWFENGQLKKTITYSKGKRIDELRTYWENGNVKRKDNYENDEQVNSGERFISGRCYNEAGKKVDYFPFYQDAKFPGGTDSMSIFIRRNIKNVLTDSLIKVHVRFFINSKGEISNAQIIKNNSAVNAIKIADGIDTKAMEEEAIRLISAMPNWNPALIDGEAVGIYVNKDILFGKIFDINGIYTVVEKMPEFKGGETELLKFLSQNIKYPILDQENGVSGKVVIKFVVTKTGKIGEVKVLRSVSKLCDEEAIRVVKSLPNFIPGVVNGENVAVWYTLPIGFKLQGKSNSFDFKKEYNTF